MVVTITSSTHFACHEGTARLSWLVLLVRIQRPCPRERSMVTNLSTNPAQRGVTSLSDVANDVADMYCCIVFDSLFMAFSHFGDC